MGELQEGEIPADGEADLGDAPPEQDTGPVIDKLKPRVKSYADTVKGITKQNRLDHQRGLDRDKIERNRYVLEV